MKFLRSFISAFLGGVSVSFGCAAYHMYFNTSPALASLMFAVSFLVIAIFKFNLFTDKIGHLFDKGKAEKNLETLGITLIGNLLGAFTCGTLFMSQFYDFVTDAAETKITKLDFLSVFFSSVLCGILIYIALHGFRKAGSGFTGSLILVGAIMLIGLCGFEYAVSNAFITGAGISNMSNYSKYGVQIAILWFGSALGNAIGAAAFAYLRKVSDTEESSKK